MLDSLSDRFAGFEISFYMRKLRDQNNLNSSEEFDRIFHERRSRPHEAMDTLRWKSLMKFYNGGRLIDMGCLDSLVPQMAKKKFPKAEIWGLDRAHEAIEEMQQVAPSILYIVGDATETKFDHDYFDYVVAGELIEHLDDPQKFFNEAYRILKKGGVLALTTPKEETEAGEVDGHRHLWSFNRHSIQEMAKNAYFSKVKMGEIPSWIKRRISYHHPYLLAYLWK